MTPGGLVLLSAMFLVAGGCRWRIEQEEAPVTSADGWLLPRNDLPPEPSFPFTPVPGEAAPAQPCGPKRRGPCLLLGWERYNFARSYAHAAWFMDTDGGEYEFHASRAGRPGVLPEDVDPVRSALIDQVVSVEDFDIIVAASTALPRRVTTAELRHAQALLALSQGRGVETPRRRGCHDCADETVTGYLFVADRKAALPLPLEQSRGHVIAKENSARAARELVQWVHDLRGHARPPTSPPLNR